MLFLTACIICCQCASSVHRHKLCDRLCFSRAKQTVKELVVALQELIFYLCAISVLIWHRVCTVVEGSRQSRNTNVAFSER